MSYLDAIVERLEADYTASPRGHHIGKGTLPSRDAIIEIVRACFEVFYPGYHGPLDVTPTNVRYRTGSLLSSIDAALATQVGACVRHAAESVGIHDEPWQQRGVEIAQAVVTKLPDIRASLLDDVQAAYDGDPAAASFDEILLAYPGLLAITVHRVAHELFVARVPLMPRIMSEWAHAESGADIHPGAAIGRRFFIDHATGVVIGETTVIGDDVKLYQGVTLGARSVHKDARGRRHPTVEDSVTIYANATVLGGDTIVGEGSIIGGGAFITKSVPPRSRVSGA